MGDFTRLYRCSFIKEDSGSLRKPGEALASGQAYLRSGLWQWHSAQVLLFKFNFKFRPFH